MVKEICVTDLVAASRGLQQLLLGSPYKLKTYSRRSPQQVPLYTCLVLQLADEVIRSRLPGEIAGGAPGFASNPGALVRAFSEVH